MKPILIAVMAVLSGLAGLACIDMPADLGQPSYVHAEPEDYVYYFGDSLGAMSQSVERAHYQTYAPRVAKWDNTIAGGLRFQNWWPAMETVPPGATVVVELGWNNLMNEAINTGELEDHLIGTFDRLRARGVTRTIWFSINMGSANLRAYPQPSRAAWLNARVRGLVADGTYSDIGLEIYEWDQIAAPLGRSILSADDLHHNGLGTEIFGCAMYEAVNGSACMADLLGALAPARTPR